MHLLVDQPFFLRLASDRHDAALGRAIRRRVPGRACGHQEDEIGISQMAVAFDAQPQIVIVGKIAVTRGAAADDGDCAGVGEFDQGFEGADVAAGELSDDHRVLGGPDFGRRTFELRRDGLGLLSRTRFPWTQNWLNRSVQGGPEHDR